MLWRALGFPDVPDGEAGVHRRVGRGVAAPQRALGHVDVHERRRRRRRSSRRCGRSVPACRASPSRCRTRSSRACSRRARPAPPTRRSRSAPSTRSTGSCSPGSTTSRCACRCAPRCCASSSLPSWDRARCPSSRSGFVDLVGYTALSQELDGAELNALVARFESVTYDTVAQLGGRLVKTIGDEVMFVAEEPEIALQIALELTDRTRQDEVLPRARAGMACGPALAREGDYYGAVVNLAHRLVEIARPQSVIVGAELADALDRSRRLHVPAAAEPTDPRHRPGRDLRRPGGGRAGRGRPGVGTGRGG